MNAKIDSVELKYWFGPFRLGSARFRVAVETIDVAELAAGRHRPTPGLDDVPDGADGVFRSSEPRQASDDAISRDGALLRYVQKSFPRYVADLTTDYEGYLGKFSSKTRSGLRRKIRKFEQASGGEIDWRSYTSPAALREFHGHAREISRLTYQEKLFDAGIPDDEGFVEETVRLARDDHVRAYLLFLEGRPVAYLYCPIVDGVVVYGFLGFDPQHARSSPGTVLQLLAFEQLFEEGKYSMFDFTEGEGEHKKLFSTTSFGCANVFYLKPSLSNRMRIYLHYWLAWMSGRFEAFVRASGVHRRLRRLLRGQKG